MGETCKCGKAPSPEQIAEMEKAKGTKAPDEPEVQAQSEQLAAYTLRCYGCGAVNWVQDWWSWFICRRCGTQNSV